MFEHQYSPSQNFNQSIHFPNQKKKEKKIPFRTKPSLFDTVKSKAKLFFICFDNNKTFFMWDQLQFQLQLQLQFQLQFQFQFYFPLQFSVFLSSWYNCTKSFKFVAWNLVLDYDQTKQKLQQQQLQLQQQITTTCQKTRTDNKIRTYLLFIVFQLFSFRLQTWIFSITFFKHKMFFSFFSTNFLFESKKKNTNKINQTINIFVTCNIKKNKIP